MMKENNPHTLGVIGETKNKQMFRQYLFTSRDRFSNDLDRTKDCHTCLYKTISSMWSEVTFLTTFDN